MKPTMFKTYRAKAQTRVLFLLPAEPSTYNPGTITAKAATPQSYLTEAQGKQYWQIHQRIQPINLVEGSRTASEQSPEPRPVKAHSHIPTPQHTSTPGLGNTCSSTMKCSRMPQCSKRNPETPCLPKWPQPLKLKPNCDPVCIPAK